MAKLGPGARIGDQYKLIRKIGEGGCGEVFLAEQTSLGRHVVVKLMHPELSRDASYVARFGREARLAARLSHHHTASIYAFGETPEHVLWIAMEYIEGESLHNALAKESPRELAELLAPVADVLDRAGSMGIIHRDVKPDNVIVSPDGGGRRAVLLDFGLARPMEDNDKLTAVGVAVGSPTYMSPEQVFGPQVDSATDRYAFGVILYIAVAKRPPFRHDDRVQLVLMHKRQPVPALNSVVPTIPAGHPLDAFFTRALAKQPQDRFPTAKEMIAEFIRCLDQAPLDQRDQRDQKDGPAAAQGPASIGHKTTGPQPVQQSPPVGATRRPPPAPPPRPRGEAAPPAAPREVPPPVPSRPRLTTTHRDIAAGWGDAPALVPQRGEPQRGEPQKGEEPISPRTLEARAARERESGGPATAREPASAALRSTMPQIPMLGKAAERDRPPEAAPANLAVLKAQAEVKELAGDLADEIANQPNEPTQQTNAAAMQALLDVPPEAPAAEAEAPPAAARQNEKDDAEGEDEDEELLPGHRRLVARTAGAQLDVICATEALLGKHRDCEVVCRAFPTPEQDHITHGVSRQHARLRVASGKLYIEDLGSLNGTYLDGRRLTTGPVALYDEARIRLGPVLTIEVRLFRGGAALLRRVDAYDGGFPPTLMLWDKVALGEAALGLVPPTGDSVTRWGVMQNSRPNGDLWWGGPAPVHWARGGGRPSRPQAIQPGDVLSQGELSIEWIDGPKPGLG